MRWNDLDIVLWDSHPLSLGATPKQVWIGGISQLPAAHVIPKPPSTKVAPTPPSFNREAQRTLDNDGLPPLLPNLSTSDTVLFSNVSKLLVRSNGLLQDLLSGAVMDENVVVIKQGKLICQGPKSECSAFRKAENPDARTINLNGGTLSPGLLAVGSLVSHLNLSEVRG